MTYMASRIGKLYNYYTLFKANKAHNVTTINFYII